MTDLTEHDMAVIELLADGRFHSGEALGAALGISRAGVWKRLQKLEGVGLWPESVRGKGYRIAGGLSLLRETAIAAQSPALPPIAVRNSTGSTNQDALDQLQQGRAAPFVLLAEYQSAGRGRRGRVWNSPFGACLYLTAAEPFEHGAAALEGLSLAVGVALADALTGLGVPEVGLKWPNDVYLGGRKAAGILIELAGDLLGDCVAVVGIGLNVRMPDAAMSNVAQPWTDLHAALGAEVDRNLLAARILAALQGAFVRFRDGGFPAFAAAWAQYDVCAGRAVRVELGGRVLEGIAAGVDRSGALCVEIEGTRQLFHGGEVSLRIA
ncbi:bifunctional biotin--[acetyl-CoA-carboxylase] ligase/biotin operon repressor BirA [Isoalcanivorax beigongshangi]|uniref:Bifunctional ligase/repressor BirA n=1 Tax=Isoalcanivorax beigongshangi TaxID=3238810 RepID=A0ABV4AK55_9GAMM